MKLILLLVVVGSASAAAYFFVPSFKQKVHSIQLPTSIKLPQSNILAKLTPATSPKEGSPTGDVKGVQTSEISASVEKAAKTLGSTAAQVFTNTTTTSDSVNVASAVSKIQGEIEKIPSQVLEQAKVAYCTQVLIEATKSATNN